MNNPALYHAITDAGLARRKTIQHIIWEWFADHPAAPQASAWHPFRGCPLTMHCAPRSASW